MPTHHPFTAVCITLPNQDSRSLRKGATSPPSHSPSAYIIIINGLVCHSLPTRCRCTCSVIALGLSIVIYFFLMYKGGSKVLFVIHCHLAIIALVHLSSSGCLSGLVVFTAVLCSFALSVAQSKSGGDRPRLLYLIMFDRSLVFRESPRIRPLRLIPLSSYLGILTLLF